MPLIPFPNIPALPGVPALPRLPGVVSTVPIIRAAIGLAAGAIWSSLQIDSRWGVYDKSGAPLGDPAAITGGTSILLNSLGLGSTQSTVSVEYTNGSQISDFPVERGSFANYNKAQSPGNAVVTLGFTGSESERSQFLAAIDAACKSVDLYDVVTPEAVYVQYNLESYNYQRKSEQGATLLRVDLRLTEIRQVSAQYTNTTSPKNPDASGQLNAGKVQTVPGNQSISRTVTNKLQ